MDSKPPVKKAKKTKTDSAAPFQDPPIDTAEAPASQYSDDEIADVPPSTKGLSSGATLNAPVVSIEAPATQRSDDEIADVPPSTEGEPWHDLRRAAGFHRGSSISCGADNGRRSSTSQ